MLIASHRSEIVELLNVPAHMAEERFPTPTNQVVISSASPVAAPQSRILWRRAVEGVYAATLDGEFAGFITVSGSLHTLHGPHSQMLGVYRSLEAAFEVLELELAFATGPTDLITTS